MLEYHVPSENNHRVHYDNNNSIEFEGQREINDALAKFCSKQYPIFHKCKLFEIRYYLYLHINYSNNYKLQYIWWVEHIDYRWPNWIQLIVAHFFVDWNSIWPTNSSTIYKANGNWLVWLSILVVANLSFWITIVSTINPLSYYTEYHSPEIERENEPKNPRIN